MAEELHAGAVPHLPPSRYVNGITTTKRPPTSSQWNMVVDRSAAVSKNVGLVPWRVARHSLHTVGEQLRKQLNRSVFKCSRAIVQTRSTGMPGVSGLLAVGSCNNNGSSAAVKAELEEGSILCRVASRLCSSLSDVKVMHAYRARVSRQLSQAAKLDHPA